MPCCNTRNQENSQPPNRKTGSTALSSTVSGTSLWKPAFCGNVTADQPGHGDLERVDLTINTLYPGT